MKVREFLIMHKVPHYIHDIPSAKPLKIVRRWLPPLEELSVKVELEKLGLKPQVVFPINHRSPTGTADSLRDQLLLVHF